MRQTVGRLTRYLAVMVAITGLSLLLVGPVTAGSGGVVLRLTLRGPVDSSDTFTLGVTPRNHPAVIDIGIICGPEAPRGYWLVCTAKTYEYPVGQLLPVGTILDYTFARPTATPGEPSRPEILYRGSVQIEAFTQTRTVVYDYALGASTLPDTALTPVTPSPLLPLGAAALLSGPWLLAAALCRLAGGLREPRGGASG